MVVRNVLLGVALLLAAITPTFAALAEDEYKHQGPFLQIGPGIVDSDGDSSKASLSMKLGVDVVEYMAIEVQHEWVPDGDEMITSFQERFSPLSGRWQPNFLAGFGFITSDETDREFLGRFGLGLDFMISENMSVGAEASYLAIMSTPDAVSATIGLRYGF